MIAELERVVTARKALETAKAQWVQAVYEAWRAGSKPIEIAACVGLSRQSVLKTLTRALRLGGAPK